MFDRTGIELVISELPPNRTSAETSRQCTIMLLNHLSRTGAGGMSGRSEHYPDSNGRRARRAAAPRARHATIQGDRRAAAWPLPTHFCVNGRKTWFEMIMEED